MKIATEADCKQNPNFVSHLSGTQNNLLYKNVLFSYITHNCLFWTPLLIII